MLPDEGSPGGHRIELEGEIAAIMALGAPDTRTPRHLAGAVAGRSGTVVAGTGFANCFAMSKAIIPPCLTIAA